MEEKKHHEMMNFGQKEKPNKEESQQNLTEIQETLTKNEDK